MSEGAAHTIQRLQRELLQEKLQSERLRKALRKVIELGERHVEEAQMRRIRDFREAVAVAVSAVNGSVGITP